MKIKFILYGIALLLFTNTIGCDDYVRRDVEDKIFVNMQSLNMFVGEKIQLTASPTDGTYKYNWLSEDVSVATVDNNGLIEVISEGFTNIIVSSGDIKTRIPLTATVRIPLEDVLLNVESLELYVGDEVAILTTLIPDESNDIPDYTWYSENSNIATVNEVGEVIGVGEGETNIVYKIGDITKKILVNSAYTYPFKGPHILSAAAPYELKAADFDFGRSGYAFYDSDDNNRTGSYKYRESNGDIYGIAVEVQGDTGVNIGYTAQGEWLVYTVEVLDAGEYIMDVSISVPNNNGKFHIQVNDKKVTDIISIPNTGGYTNWTWIPNPPVLNLTKGKHKIKYYFESGFNLKGFKFTKK